jgi:hypothetical protein
MGMLRLDHGMGDGLWRDINKHAPHLAPWTISTEGVGIDLECCCCRHG